MSLTGFKSVYSLTAVVTNAHGFVLAPRFYFHVLADYMQRKINAEHAATPATDMQVVAINDTHFWEGVP